MLFAIGLAIHLWNINTQVALPVVIISAVAALFYIVTAVLPLFDDFCPFNPAITTYWIVFVFFVVFIIIVLAVELVAVTLIISLVMSLLVPLLVLVIAIAVLVIAIAIVFSPCLSVHYAYLACRARTSPDDEQHRTEEIGQNHGEHSLPSRVTIPSFSTLAFHMRLSSYFRPTRSVFVERETPMDSVTSSMLCWMITSCNESKSIDLALEALAGADLRLPREPLHESNALPLVIQRLTSYLDVLETPAAGTHGPEHEDILRRACLYSSSFNFLIESAQGEPLGRRWFETCLSKLSGTAGEREPETFSLLKRHDWYQNLLRCVNSTT